MEVGANIEGHEEFTIEVINTHRIHRYLQLAVESLKSPSTVDILLKTREKSTIYFSQAITFLSSAGAIATSALVLHSSALPDLPFALILMA